MEIHAAAATDDSRAGLLVHALKVTQPDGRRIFCGNGLVRRAHLQRRPRFAPLTPTPLPDSGERGRGEGHVGIAVEAVFTGVVAGLDLDETHFEQRIAVAGKSQRAGDMNRADGNRFGFLEIVGDAVAGADLDLGGGTGHLTTFPGRRRGPRAAPRGADQIRSRCRTDATKEQTQDPHNRLHRNSSSLHSRRARPQTGQSLPTNRARHACFPAAASRPADPGGVAGRRAKKTAKVADCSGSSHNLGEGLHPYVKRSFYCYISFRSIGHNCCNG